ncbi:hypothetical protein K9U34_02690 [Lawsonia intracellularis]|uniref:hypothetical protein n=1 Tax=Lawsonia intracellularis TaxID=29546 RepID=UPI0003088BE6|nr:hypothetical protein [Lawsonia intracellularis]KAA0204971.1 hypothetical protein C4K43_00465 [Lawsonia intracellularis]MBZ3892506.1 hypothetical protein [Lawsonia intracellularis]OMQ06115.1 hypothetical protein BW722_00300 [Lawsonia intracellularis]RBN32480.1 hypothetical protein DR194_05910 [Lawsonia intracellularis]RBN34045.1 hypothetical protein DR192_05920 [Lawsonia intracellularis]
MLYLILNVIIGVGLLSGNVRYVRISVKYIVIAGRQEEENKSIKNMVRALNVVTSYRVSSIVPCDLVRNR